MLDRCLIIMAEAVLPRNTHSVSRTPLWPQEHTRTDRHARGNTPSFMPDTHNNDSHTRTHTHTQRLEGSVTRSDTGGLLVRVRLHQRCGPQPIWPSFRNNGHGGGLGSDWER